MLYSGRLGFAIVPDEETCGKAIELAKTEAPDAPFRVERPHITLYQAPLVDVEEELVAYVLLQVAIFKGRHFETLEVTSFERDWLFWLARRDPVLVAMHNAALFAAKHLDEAAAASSADSYRYGDAGRALLRAYGSQVVMLRFLPHVTLAHDPERGFEGHLCDSPLAAWTMASRIEEIVFAEFGDHGTIKRVIASG